MSTVNVRAFYPYEVNYNDHFETPIIAYEHILPLLDSLHQPSNDRSTHILYDPYFCNGRTKRVLQSLGFHNVIHEKRDFYKDIEENRVPFYHTFVTNPPYSSNHKERCVRYAVDRLRGCGDENGPAKPFFILMPNYVAVRNHFRGAISLQDDEEEDPLDIFYVVPQTPYEYDHPEGTGKDIPPFSSIWFCGAPSSKVGAAKDAFRKAYGPTSVGISHGVGKESTKGDFPRLVSTLQELRTLGAVPTQKRKNLKQRLKAKRKLEPEEGTMNRKKGKETRQIVPKTDVVPKENRNQKKRSKYRDENGERKKKRF